MKYINKSALLIVFLSMVFSGYAAASGPEDYCDDSGCNLEDGQPDNTLDFGGGSINLGDHFDIVNYSENDFFIKNLNINDDNIEFDRYDWDYYYENTIIHLMGEPGSFSFDQWNIDTTERITSLFYIDKYYMGDEINKNILSLNNSFIRANADTIFNTSIYFPDLLDAGTINAISITDSTIINDKKHISNDDEDIDRDILDTRLGTILNIYPVSDWADEEQRDLTVAYNFNHSLIRAQALAGISKEGCCSYSEWEDRGNTIAINLTDSQGQFNNLLINGRQSIYDATSVKDAVQVNLDNSTVSSGIYSEFYGSFRLTNTALNLSNNSVFNYLGNCTDSDNCNSFLIDDGCYSCGSHLNATYENPHYYDSYIHEININGGSNFVFSPLGEFKLLYVDRMTSDGSGIITMNTDVSTLTGDMLDIKQASGKFNVMIQDSGREPTSKEGLSLIYVGKGESGQFQLNDNKGVDIGAYTYSLASVRNGERYTWFLTPSDLSTLTEEEVVDSRLTPERPQTSPSTDGVISMASASQFILNDELENLRMRRGDMTRNTSENSNVWGRLLTRTLRINGPENSAYKLERSGMELGGDRIFDIGNDKLMVGISTSVSDNKVKHNRGGTSNIDTYTSGIYATYVAENNVYIDAVVKYAHFDNDLNVRTTNGSLAQAKYKQNGIGTSLELGYKHQFENNSFGLFVEPYGRMSYSTVKGKDFQLSNGMQAKIDHQESLLGEVGFSLGAEFIVAETAILSPYIKIAAEHELISDNPVYINDTTKFTNDFSGTAGKYGVGLNLSVNKHTSMFAEIDYVNGRNIEVPIKANIGFRINF